MHYYFRSKENLFETVFINKYKQVLVVLTEAVDGEKPYLTRLNQMMEAQFDLFVSSPKMPLFIVNEFLNNPQRLNFLKRKISLFPQEIMNTMKYDAVTLGNHGPILLYLLAGQHPGQK